jgi:hypothetical protein
LVVIQPLPAIKAPLPFRQGDGNNISLLHLANILSSQLTPSVTLSQRTEETWPRPRVDDDRNVQESWSWQNLVATSLRVNTIPLEAPSRDGATTPPLTPLALRWPSFYRPQAVAGKHHLMSPSRVPRKALRPARRGAKSTIRR